MQPNSSNFWRKCSSCKKDIPFSTPYFVCNVSTCNGQRTGYVFCSIPCFERHLPGARHKDAAAIEERSPGRSTQRIIPAQNQNVKTLSAAATSDESEVLIIASRLKDYINRVSQMNTSASVMDVLSGHVREVCSRAIQNARNDGRKTLMDRDFSFLKK